MAQQQAAQQVAKMLGSLGKWSIILGLGGSALQASLYTGAAPPSWLDSCAQSDDVARPVPCLLC